MKRIVALAGLLGCALAQSFSVEESWLEAGAAFGNTFVFSEGADAAYLGALGAGLSAYHFVDQRSFGMFARGSFLHPLVSDGPADESGYDEVYSLSVGAAGRLAITGRLALYGGLGLDCLMLGESYYRQDAASEEDYSKFTVGVGVGGHIGIKYDITDFMYANIGCALSYLFYSRTSAKSYTKENGAAGFARQDGYVKGRGMLGVEPYIGVGFNWYSESKAKPGKPKQ